MVSLAPEIVHKWGIEPRQERFSARNTPAPLTQYAPWRRYSDQKSHPYFERKMKRIAVQISQKQPGGHQA